MSDTTKYILIAIGIFGGMIIFMAVIIEIAITLLFKKIADRLLATMPGRDNLLQTDRIAEALRDRLPAICSGPSSGLLEWLIWRKIGRYADLINETPSLRKPTVTLGEVTQDMLRLMSLSLRRKVRRLAVFMLLLFVGLAVIVYVWPPI